MSGIAKVNNDCGFPTFISSVFGIRKKTYELNAEIYPEEKSGCH